MRSYLNLGASTIALAAFSAIGASAAYAQPAEPIETVTVTGTSIRGAAPVGSNLITVGQEAIENVAAATVSEVLTTVPALTFPLLMVVEELASATAGAAAAVAIAAQSPIRVFVLSIGPLPAGRGLV